MFSEALLRALAETTEDELDAGRWRKRVQTFEGAIELMFSLPFLLEAEAGELPTHVPPAAMPRAAERESVRIARLLEGKSFESLEAADAEIARLNQEGDRVESPARDLTPLERAQELAYDAMEAHGRLRIKRARQARGSCGDRRRPVRRVARRVLGTPRDATRHARPARAGTGAQRPGE